MDKDSYAKMVTRREIAASFINKLDKVEMKDLDILPALNDWVETGDDKMFEEYRTFHFLANNEEKEKELQEMREEYEEYKDHKEKYSNYISEYTKWLNDTIEKMESMEAEVSANVSKMREFLCSRDDVSWKARSIWVRIGDKLVSAKSFEIFAGKPVVILNTENEVLLAKSPIYPIRRGFYPKPAIEKL